MREHVPLAVDIAALSLMVLAVWVLAHRRSMAGVLLATLGIAALAAMASLRALPSPTRDELRVTVGALQDELAGHKQRVRALEGENAQLEERLRSLEDATRQLKLEAFDRLMEALAARHYSIRLHDDDEWLEGQRGRYYRVRLSDARGQPFTFARGEYRIQAHSQAILQAFDKFQSQVLKSVPSGWATQILLRGGATVEPLVSTTGALGVEFGAVGYRHENDAGRYSAISPALPFPAQATNADLPLLRAAEYRAMLFGPSASDAIELLHREPSGIGDEDRVVEIILYVKPD